MESKCPDETLRMRRMNLNQCILRMFKDTFSLGAACIMTLFLPKVRVLERCYKVYNLFYAYKIVAMAKTCSLLIKIKISADMLKYSYFSQKIRVDISCFLKKKKKKNQKNQKKIILSSAQNANLRILLRWNIEKKSRRFYGKYWQLPASAFTVIFLRGPVELLQELPRMMG